MRVQSIHLFQLEIPMHAAMIAAHGSVAKRRTILVRVDTDLGRGWGECVALNEPTYRPEWSDGEWLVLSQLLAPALVGTTVGAHAPTAALERFVGHSPAKASLELALLDAWSRSQGASLASLWGSTPAEVECIGVLSAGDNSSALAGYRGHGYHRLKVKISPEVDPGSVAHVLQECGAGRHAADANGSFSWDDDAQREKLSAIDQMGFAYLEQPVRTMDQSRDLRAHVQTPVALDESIESWDTARQAVDSGACDVVVVKPSNVGGWRVAVDILELCAARGLSGHVGAMLETGVGRAANAALAAAHQVPAELSYDGRWLEHSMVHEGAPIADGFWHHRDNAGLGVTVDEDALRHYAVRTCTVRP